MKKKYNVSIDEINDLKLKIKDLEKEIVELKEEKEER